MANRWRRRLSSKMSRSKNWGPQWGGEWSDCRIMAWSLQCKWDRGGTKAAVGRQGWWLTVATIPGFWGRTGREPTISRKDQKGRPQKFGVSKLHVNITLKLFLQGSLYREDDHNSFLYLADFWSSLFVHRVHRLHGSNSGFPLNKRLIFERRMPQYIQVRGPSEFMVELYNNQNRLWITSWDKIRTISTFSDRRVK